MKKLKWESSIYVVETISDLDNIAYRNLCEAAHNALQDAYAIYSNYKVGAAVLMSNGAMVRGSNQENAVYPLGLCAERVSIFSACTQYPNEQIVAIAVATKKTVNQGEMPAFPCGSCRQVMIEQENRFDRDIPIFVLNSDQKIYMIKTVKDILPFAFDQNFLSK